MIFQVINKTKVPIKIWTPAIESEALEDTIAIANYLPVVGHIALMPDVHAGKGMPIGGVVGLRNAISPMAVGSDIGCGMLAVKTNLHSIDIDAQKEIYRLIREAIPVGFDKKPHKVEWAGFKNAPHISSVTAELGNAALQLGTLGGGNHFIEFQIGSDGHVWFMIHSGSRNLGKKLGDFYHALALDDGIATFPKLPYFLADSELGKEYEAAMNFALDFAYQNRQEMARAIKAAISVIIGGFTSSNIKPALFAEEINIHHNYAVRENHFGEAVMLHRKGATLATKDTVGIIPGSQGTASYIVKGLGNPESFQSCSHGAGRIMSRSKAKKMLTVEQCNKSMQERGILVDFTRGNLDEALEAYKDITEVMSNQDDLVEILVELKPYQIAAIKG